MIQKNYCFKDAYTINLWGLYHKTFFTDVINFIVELAIDFVIVSHFLLAWTNALSYQGTEWIYETGHCGLYYKTITIVIMIIVVMLQIVASLTIVIDDGS